MHELIGRRLLGAIITLGLATGGVTGIAAPGTAVADPAGAGPGVAAPAPIADGRLVVGLDPGTSPAEAQDVATDAGDEGVVVLDGRAVIVNVPPDRVSAEAEDLRRDPRVRYVEPNYRVSAAVTPNDPYFPYLYGLQDAQPGGIRAQSAWNTTMGAASIVVGVLDTGIDTTHPDLVGNLWSNHVVVGGCAYGTHGYNVFTDTCVPEDDNGHGTHVAGTIGATGGNGAGVIGVAPRTALMALKMLDANGNGSTIGAITAIDWAVAAKQAGVNLRVLSASWAGAGYSQALVDAIQRAGDAGILFVAAAGNSALNVDAAPTYPCAYPVATIICVAATTSTDALASFSNYGAGSVDLAAPGVSIMSTVPPGLVGGCGTAAYCAFNGTSMATPHVSGAAALVIASDPTVSVAALRARLIGAVDAVPALSGKVASGGRLDVCKAIPGCGAAPSAPTSPRDLSVTVAHGRAALRWAPPSSNGNASTVTGYSVTGPTATLQLGPGATGVTVTGLSDNVNATFTVRALNGVGASAPATHRARPTGGGYELDGFGALHPIAPVGSSPPSPPTGGPHWPGWDIARGVALLPDGTGGYVLDGWGGMHGFSIGANPAPPTPIGVPYWRNRDIARGVALLADGTAGYVLDGFGGLHPFSLGDRPAPPPVVGGPTWPGWNIARGVAITADSHGGYVVDGFGGIHPFALPGFAAPPPATGGPSWPGWAIVRGITLVPGTNGGWVLDGWGGLHPFATGGVPPPPARGAPYWRGWDIARGVSV